MTDESTSRLYSGITIDAQIPFRYTIIHGADPTKRSAEQRAVTSSLNLVGLVFETQNMTHDGWHLSFTESSYARNTLEIVLELGKSFESVELLGQVEWYERRTTVAGHTFMVGVNFIDIQADALAVLRDFLKRYQQQK